MFKHILIMGIFQLIVLAVLLFAGDLFIPEFEDLFDEVDNFKREWKYTQDGMIRSGRQRTIDGRNDYQQIYDQTDNFSRHMTFIFNTFVMMQIFNFLNCRKIHDQVSFIIIQLNIFTNICSNFLFIFIVLIILVLQIILVTFAGFAFGVYSFFGLHPYQWLISVISYIKQIGIGSLCLIVRLLVTFLPDFKCCHSSDKEVDFAHVHSKVTGLKISSTLVDLDVSYNKIVQ